MMLTKQTFLPSVASLFPPSCCHPLWYANQHLLTLLLKDIEQRLTRFYGRFEICVVRDREWQEFPDVIRETVKATNPHYAVTETGMCAFADLQGTPPQLLPEWTEQQITSFNRQKRNKRSHLGGGQSEESTSPASSDGSSSPSESPPPPLSSANPALDNEVSRLRSALDNEYRGYALCPQSHPSYDFWLKELRDERCTELADPIELEEVVAAEMGTRFQWLLLSEKNARYLEESNALFGAANPEPPPPQQTLCEDGSAPQTEEYGLAGVVMDGTLPGPPRRARPSHGLLPVPALANPLVPPPHGLRRLPPPPYGTASPRFRYQPPC
ncbi:unnamed protein product [Cyprideis torosa]|uniref:Uncharacterized protein n=1 Tax=Cyprideis torosa TaxID=163714 RepID=A0A7R8ZJZ1_9CRUS|nr:unnamed protein product [Cyprideis torosa]CAG0883361.1 unnamed protein product [Cyprideis torosa]